MPMPALMASRGELKCHRIAVDLDDPGILTIQAGQHVHQRALAGTVLPKQRVDLSRTRLQSPRGRWQARRGIA